MNRCTKCLIPDTRPDTHFDEEGVCSACRTAQKVNGHPTPGLGELAKLLTRPGRGLWNPQYDCIVPSSGGKDSTWQVLMLKQAGFKPLVVTATTCHLTPIGRANIDNLAKHADTLEVTPDRTMRAKLNRVGLMTVGDISWPEHVAIFTTPFKIAYALKIPLIFYGENPQAAYGGPPGTDEAHQMTRRWVSEFGGFLGLRPQDLANTDMGCCGKLTTRDMLPYMLTEIEQEWCEKHATAYFLGQFLGWDSHRNARAAVRAGMRVAIPGPGNYWDHENLDNAQTGLHDYMMFRKYGYGRACAQVSVDIRRGLLTREQGKAIVAERDGQFPYRYGGVWLDEVLERIGLTRQELEACIEEYSNPDIIEQLEEEGLCKSVKEREQA